MSTKAPNLQLAASADLWWSLARVGLVRDPDNTQRSSRKKREKSGEKRLIPKAFIPTRKVWAGKHHRDPVWTHLFPDFG